MTGIIGAMKEEISSFTSHSKIESKQEIAGMKFYRGKLSNAPIVIVQSGIGKVNAAVATQILISQFNISQLIFTGLAGSGKNEIKIGDFVIATSLVQHDFDLRHFGREKGVIPATGHYFQANKTLNDKLSKVITQLQKENPEYGTLYSGIIASGDSFIAESNKIKEITKEFNCFAVEMEGAAVAQVCAINAIPFAILRTISDKANENAQVDFKTVLDKASTQEFEILKNFFKIKLSP